MRYIPHTEADIARMLRVIGQPSVAALFAHIPEALEILAKIQAHEQDEPEPTAEPEPAQKPARKFPWE